MIVVWRLEAEVEENFADAARFLNRMSEWALQSKICTANQNLVLGFIVHSGPDLILDGP